jgi:hypothetical protein
MADGVGHEVALVASVGTRNLCQSWRYLPMFLAVGLGLILRAADLGRWPIGFRYTLEYDSANAARSIYLWLTAQSSVGWERAWLQARPGRFVEPPIMQTLTALTYLVGGSERPWTSVLFAMAFWFGAATLLFFAVRHWAGLIGATVAASYLILAPFALAVSDSFQPEPIVVFGLALTVWVASLGDVTRGRLFGIAAVAGAFAGMTKPGIAMLFVAAIYAASALRYHPRDRERLTRVVALIALASAPAVGFALVIIPDQAGDKILPQLLLTDGFFRGWIGNVIRAVGPVALMGGAVGFITWRPLRPFGIGLAIAYLGYSGLFAWHTMTHDYYQLPMLVVVAIGLGGSAVRLGAFLRRADRRRLASAVAAIAFLGVLAAVTTPSDLREHAPGLSGDEEIYQRIGKAIPPGSSVIAYAPNYGKALMFVAKLIVTDWPHGSQLVYQQQIGRAAPPAQIELAEFIRTTHATFFVYCAPPDASPSLLGFLASRFPIVAVDPSFRIFDLTAPYIGQFAQ